jgi:hypothetical protein
MDWHYQRGDLSFGTILVALLLGPILSIIIRDEEKKRKKEESERETNDRHRRWFQTMGLINRQRLPIYGRTIPPPPPISRARVNQEEVRAQWRRENGVTKMKDFKFFK